MEKRLELKSSDIKKLTKSLNKFWDLRDPLMEPDQELKKDLAKIKKKKKRYCYLDPTQVFGMHFKDKLLEKWFITNFAAYHPTSAPIVDYKNHKRESSAMYYIEYLHDIMKIMSVFDERITLKIRADAPIELENDFLICWIAPRIEQNDIHK